MSTKVKVNGTWKNALPQVKVSGAWKVVSQKWVKVSGAWKGLLVNVYSGVNDDTVRKINSSGNQVWSFTGHTDSVYDVAVDTDGNVYSASLDGTVRKIDSSGSEVWSFTGSTGAVLAVAVG